MIDLKQDPLAAAQRMVESCAHPMALPSIFDGADASMADKVARLDAAIRNMPQVTDLETSHHFVPGMYCRRLMRKAGTVIVGKVHRAPHFFMCSAGELLVLHEGGVRRMQAGDVIECAPGTKRITFAVTDAVGVTIHKTDETDLDKIEEELIEPDEHALFDSSNAIKALLEGAK